MAEYFSPFVFWAQTPEHISLKIDLNNARVSFSDTYYSIGNIFLLQLFKYFIILFVVQKVIEVFV